MLIDCPEEDTREGGRREREREVWIATTCMHGESVSRVISTGDGGGEGGVAWSGFEYTHLHIRECMEVKSYRRGVRAEKGL